MKAIVIEGPGKAVLDSSRAPPKLRDEYIRVKTVAVALNPTGKRFLLDLMLVVR